MSIRKTVIGAACAVLTTLNPVMAGTGADDVAAVDPYVRAIPPVVPNSGAFLTLQNTGDVEHRLVAASSPAAETVELHAHINDNGMMRMRRVDGIDIPAKGTTQLRPGGLHIMLLGLKAPLRVGDEITFELRFADGSAAQISAPVRKITTGGMTQGQH